MSAWFHIGKCQKHCWSVGEVTIFGTGFGGAFFSLSLKSLLSLPRVSVEVSTDVITLGILNPKVAKKEMWSVHLFSFQ